MLLLLLVYTLPSLTLLPPHCLLAALFSLRTRANALEEERNKLESDISLLRSDFKKASLDFDTKIEVQVPTQGSVSAVDAGIGENGVSAREKEEEVKSLLVSVTCQSISNDKLFILLLIDAFLNIRIPS